MTTTIFSTIFFDLNQFLRRSQVSRHWQVLNSNVLWKCAIHYHYFQDPPQLQHHRLRQAHLSPPSVSSQPPLLQPVCPRKPAHLSTGLLGFHTCTTGAQTGSRTMQTLRSQEISSGFRQNGLGWLGQSNQLPPEDLAPLPKVKTEEKEKWWILGRGRKGSKEKKENKENKMSWKRESSSSNRVLFLSWQWSF